MATAKATAPTRRGNAPPLLMREPSRSGERHVVWRDDRTRTPGVATHAYTYHFDRMLVAHARGVQPKLYGQLEDAKMLDEDDAEKCVPGFVFFCPCHMLWPFVHGQIDPTIKDAVQHLPGQVIGIALGRDEDGAPSACATELVMDATRWPLPSDPAARTAALRRRLALVMHLSNHDKAAPTHLFNALRSMMVRVMLGVAGRRTIGIDDPPTRNLDASLAFVWNETLDRMLSAMLSGMRQIELKPPATSLWRGADRFRVPLSMTAEDVACRLSASIFSTTTDRKVAESFAGQAGVLVEIRTQGDEDLWGIDVHAALPAEWRCFEEKEIILANGHLLGVDGPTKLIKLHNPAYGKTYGGEPPDPLATHEVRHIKLNIRWSPVAARATVQLQRSWLAHPTDPRWDHPGAAIDRPLPA